MKFERQKLDEMLAVNNAMTDEQLAAIEARATTATTGDVLALVAEVRRLREVLALSVEALRDEARD